MKNKYLFAVLLVSFISNTNAQIIVDDDMEYPNGIPTSSTWWDCNTSCPIIVGPNAGHNSDYAGFISSDLAGPTGLFYTCLIFGTWTMAYSMNIPTGQGGYLIVEGNSFLITGESIVGNIYFNDSLTTPGQGYLDRGTETSSDDIYFNFPHDEWFRVIMNFDLSTGIAAATWQMYVDGQEVIPSGTAFDENPGTFATCLGGLFFYPISGITGGYYIDDVWVADGAIAGIEENAVPSFSIYPNPAQAELNILFEEEISEIKIYDLNGRLLTEGVSDKLVDVSKLASGVYFLELISINGKSVQKFIKE